MGSDRSGTRQVVSANEFEFRLIVAVLFLQQHIQYKGKQFSYTDRLKENYLNDNCFAGTPECGLSVYKQLRPGSCGKRLGPQDKNFPLYVILLQS